MGGKTKAKKAGPPIDATSKEEEAFIQYVSSDRDSRSDGMEWFMLILLQQGVLTECRRRGAEGEALRFVLGTQEGLLRSLGPEACVKNITICYSGVDRALCHGVCTLSKHHMRSTFNKRVVEMY